MKKNNKIQTFYLFCAILISCLSTGLAQDGLMLPAHIKKDKIRFQLVNNLVIIPVEVNGAKLSFLLDTGVNSTILFGVTEEDSLRVNNAKPIRIRGLGEGEGVIALESENNLMKVGEAIDRNHSIYVIFEEALNFSTRMGIPIHGIIGYDFFKQFVVKTDYNLKRITIYDPATYNKRKCFNCEELDITLHNNKPYITIKMSSLSIRNKNITLLVDSGSSDALWLFDDTDILENDSTKYFDDFLGLGFSGNIFGKRSKLEQISLKGFKIKEVKVAFPDNSAIENINFFKERDGSIGGDVLKRFTVTIDYGSKKMILKKNSNFNDPFYYNMSGLTIEHDGLEVVTELRTYRNFSFGNPENTSSTTTSQAITDVSVSTEFALVPRYVVVEVRKDSPADKAGLKIGDEIVTVNGSLAYKRKLYELNTLFSSKVGKRISLQVKRDEKLFKVKITLQKVI